MKFRRISSFVVQILTNVWTFVIFPINSKMKIGIKFFISKVERTYYVSVTRLVIDVTLLIIRLLILSVRDILFYFIQA